MRCAALCRILPACWISRSLRCCKFAYLEPPAAASPAARAHRLFMSAAVLPAGAENFQPAGFDPFADAAEGDDSGKDYVHIRVQQRNGKKSLTTIQGLDKSFDYKKILKAFKKAAVVNFGTPRPELKTELDAAEFCCNGNVVEDSELGHVIQLQGDQRKNVSGFLVANKLAKKDVVKIHGF